MNNRRKLVIALGAGALSAPFSSFAQQQGKVWRIGSLSSNAGIGSTNEAFRHGMRELGYIEGKNLVIEWRFSKGNVDLLAELATELVRLKVDCIVTNGMNATRAAKRATDAIPIIMQSAGGDPVRNGVVASLARPGGNVTGFISIGAELFGKQLELLKVTLPKASRFAILWDPNSLPATLHFKETEIAARAMGIELQSLEVRNSEDFEEAFRTAAKGRAQALVVVSAGVTNSHRVRVAGLAVKTRLPALYTGSSCVPDGGLMSYSSDADDNYRRSAAYVNRILKGAKPADLPVQQPTKFEFVINLNAAKQIGLTIPPSVLARADKVIE